MKQNQLQLKEIFTLESSAHCHTFPHKPPLNGGLYKGCKFKNICLTSGGGWKLFLPKEKALRLVGKLNTKNSKSDIFTVDGRLDQSIYNQNVQPLICHDRWEWVCFKPSIESPKDLISIDQNNTVLLGDNTNIKMSKRFKWYTDPVLTLERAWIPINFGHALLEDIIPAFSMMLSLNFENERPLFMNDLRNIPAHGTSIHQISAIQSKGREFVERKSAEWAAMLSIGNPLSLCKSSVKEHPCPDYDEPEEDPETIQACFSSLQFGYHSKMLFEGLTDRETVIYAFKQHIIKNWNLDALKKFYKPMFKENQDTFLIGIQRKPENSINLDLINNVEELKEHLYQNLHILNRQFGKKVKIIAVELEKMNIIQQVLFFMYEIDIYVTTQGAASYYSFLMREDTAIIYSPSCVAETNTCSDKNIMFQRVFSHLKVNSMVNYNINMLECVNKQTNATIAFDSKYDYGTCLLKVDKHIFLQMVLDSY